MYDTGLFPGLGTSSQYAGLDMLRLISYPKARHIYDVCSLQLLSVTVDIGLQSKGISCIDLLYVYVYIVLFTCL